jgi:hypothetical protein
MTDATQQSVLNAQWNAATLAAQAEEQRMRPSVLFRPSLSIDGDQYCALYGDNLTEGVAGFGDTAELAMADFDRAWREMKAPKPSSGRAFLL